MNINPEELKAKAMKIVKIHSGLAAIAALSPLPVTDVAGIGGVQLTMLIRLGKLYEIDTDITEFKDMIIGSVGGLVTGKILEWAASLIKTIPVIGTFLGTAIQVPLAFAITYAIGRAVIYFLEMGFDIKNIKGTDLQEKAKEFISEGKELFKQEVNSIIDKAQDKEFVKQQFIEINDILKPFLKSEEFIKKFTSSIKDAFEIAIKNKQLDEELKDIGKEIKEVDNG